MHRPTLLLLVTEDWYLVSHRLPLVAGAVAAGYRVVVACRVSGHQAAIEGVGAEVVPLQLRREGRNPLGELRALAELVALYRAIRPDVAHHVAMKPVLYGSIAARFAGTKRVVNALAGLGYAFTGGGRRLVRTLLSTLFRLLLNRDGWLVLLQNPDDAARLVDRGIVGRDRVRIIRGAGVELDRFVVRPFPEGSPVVLLPARMLKDKGVVEFVEAAAELRAAGVTARFVLAGGEDVANPAAVPRVTLERWVADGDIEWWGHCVDMAATLAKATIVCLPSYREGLPKALLEGAAVGRPIVTTDVPGCREVVTEGENGLLVPARNSEALAGALRRLIDDPALAHRMGRRGREIVERDFAVGAVVARTLELYQ